MRVFTCFWVFFGDFRVLWVLSYVIEGIWVVLDFYVVLMMVCCVWVICGVLDIKFWVFT